MGYDRVDRRDSLQMAVQSFHIPGGEEPRARGVGVGGVGVGVGGGGGGVVVVP